MDRVAEVCNITVVEYHRAQAGRFIVATNLLDEKTWSADKVLLEYKDQTCERGFRFLKDPLFFVSRFFLKSPKRIVALMMIMCLAFLVYAQRTSATPAIPGECPRNSTRSKRQTNSETYFTLVADDAFSLSIWFGLMAFKH